MNYFIREVLKLNMFSFTDLKRSKTRHPKLVDAFSDQGTSYDIGPGITKMSSTASNDIQGPFRVVSNLWKPSQKLVYEALRFEQDKIMETLKAGSFTLPLNLNIELTGQLNPPDQKHLSVKFILDTSEGVADRRGFTPCRVGFGIRKGYQQGPKNSTFLTFDFDNFVAIVEHMRTLFQTGSEIVASGRIFESVSETKLPIHKVIKEIPGSESRLLLLSLNLWHTSATGMSMEKEVTPVISIREYFEDSVNNCFQPSQRGVTMALNACYMLMYPVSHCVIIVHDALVGMKQTFTRHSSMLREGMIELEQFIDNWNIDDTQGLDDYENMIKGREMSEESGPIAKSVTENDSDIEAINPDE